MGLCTIPLTLPRMCGAFLLAPGAGVCGAWLASQPAGSWGSLLAGVCARASQKLLNTLCTCDLRRSQLFYYSAGISVGLLASLLIVFYVMSKAMPKVRA